MLLEAFESLQQYFQGGDRHLNRDQNHLGKQEEKNKWGWSGAAEEGRVKIKGEGQVQRATRLPLKPRNALVLLGLPPLVPAHVCICLDSWLSLTPGARSGWWAWRCRLFAAWDAPGDSPEQPEACVWSWRCLPSQSKRLQRAQPRNSECIRRKQNGSWRIQHCSRLGC